MSDIFGDVFEVGYVIVKQKEKCHLGNSRIGFDYPVYETTIKVDMYYSVEKYSEIIKEKKIGSIEVSVVDRGTRHFCGRIADYIHKAIIEYSKTILGNNKIECHPFRIKNG